MHHMKDQKSWNDCKFFYMTLFFKLVECIDDICVISILYYRPLVWTRNHLFLWLWTASVSLQYSKIFIEIIYIRGTWIIFIMNMTIDYKVLYLILTPLQLSMVNILLRLQSHVFVLDSLNLIAMIYDEKLILSFISIMACLCINLLSSAILLLSCCQTWGNNAL